MSNRKIIKWMILAMCLAIVGFAAFTFVKSYLDRRAQEADGEIDTGIITYKGEKYKRDVDVKTILFLGVDKEVWVEEEEHPGEAGQADSINLYVYNKKTKKAEIIQISRDTMVNIDIFDQSFQKIMTTEAQLALQYAYGDGKKRSCRMVADRVTEILEGVSINRYLSLTIDGMIVAADAVGGVTMTIPEDYTWIDPLFEKDAVVTLDGNLTEKYVRSRDMEQLDSNNQRMERQSQYMTALIDKLQTMEISYDKGLEIYDTMEPYMATNLSADEMMKLQEYECAEEKQFLPGTITSENEHAQYHLDEDGVMEIVVEKFYKKL